MSLSGIAHATSAPGVITLEDATGDDDGPGTYRMPLGDAFPRGSFDLRRVTLTPSEHGLDDTVLIEITLGGRLPIAREARVSRERRGSFLLVQIDLYIDNDRIPGSGETRTVPGRRVVIDPADGWERAVVITSLPGRVADALRHTAPELARHMTVVAPLRSHGRTVVARVPLTALGGRPSPDWGYVLLTTSVTLSSSIRGLVLGRGDEPNIYTREVTWGPGSCENWDEAPDGRPCTFGGCDPCEGHPRVLDALVSGEDDSRRQLRAYGPSRWAALRARVPSGEAMTPSLLKRPRTTATPDEQKPTPPIDQVLPCSGGGRFPIHEADRALVTVSVADRALLDGIGPGRLGDLLGPDGQRIGRVVVTRRSGGVLVAERIAPTDAKIAPAAVRFRCQD